MPVRVQLVQVSVQPEQAVSVIFQEQHLTYETVQQASAEIDRIMQATSGICTEEIFVVIKQVAFNAVYASLTFDITFF